MRWQPREQRSTDFSTNDFKWRSTDFSTSIDEFNWRRTCRARRINKQQQALVVRWSRNSIATFDHNRFAHAGHFAMVIVSGDLEASAFATCVP
jgi:hypothetical protein